MDFWNFYHETNLGAGSPDSIRAEHKEAPHVKASETREGPERPI